MRVPPAALIVGDDLLAEGCVDVVDDHLGAFGGQALGDAFADAATGTGDDDGLVLDAHRLSSLLMLSGSGRTAA